MTTTTKMIDAMFIRVINMTEGLAALYVEDTPPELVVEARALAMDADTLIDDCYRSEQRVEEARRLNMANMTMLDHVWAVEGWAARERRRA